MFIIEGLGEKMANSWADKIEEQAQCDNNATRFLRYHGENDENHMQRFYQMLNMVAVNDERSKRIVKTARVVGRLYAMQLEERCFIDRRDDLMASQSLLEVLEYDDSLPIEKEALDYWLADMKHPCAWVYCQLFVWFALFSFTSLTFKALASLSVQRPSFFTRLDLLVHEMVDHAGGQRADIEAATPLKVTSLTF